MRAELRVPAQAQGEEIESGLAPSHNLKIIYSRDLRKQNKGEVQCISRVWCVQACNSVVEVTLDARARGRAGCGAGHRQSSAHRRLAKVRRSPVGKPV